MITQIMRSINNHFARDNATGELFGAESGDFNILDNEIIVNGHYLTGQYVYIFGSILNDGVYIVKNFSNGKIELNDLINEIFFGMIYSLRVPRDFLSLVDEIKAFNESRDGKTSNVTSGSFGIQSKTFATDENGMVAGWDKAFRSKLNKFRRHNPDIEV